MERLLFESKGAPTKAVVMSGVVEYLLFWESLLL